MSVQITIIGLGQIGTSLGLALSRSGDKVSRTGTDRDRSRAQQAQKLGAVDQTSSRLEQSVRGADIVVLAVPVDELRETLEVIGINLRDGAVVINMTPVSGVIAHMAEELIPNGRSFINMTPALNPDYLDEAVTGIDAAHADLFEKGVMIITSGVQANQKALALATELAETLGATPLFADPAEVDGLTAAIQILPQLAAAALLTCTIDQPGWREARKVAGRSYAAATAPLLHQDESQGVSHAAVLNRDNVVRLLDNLIAALRDLRGEIAAGDADALHEHIQRARANRELWHRQRQAGDWASEDVTRSKPPETGGALGKMFGLRPKIDRKDK